MSFKHSFTPALNNSTLLINAMRRRQGGGNNSMTTCPGVPGSGSLSEGHNTPCSSPPMTPRDRKLGVLFV